MTSSRVILAMFSSAKLKQVMVIVSPVQGWKGSVGCSGQSSWHTDQAEQPDRQRGIGRYSAKIDQGGSSPS
jgi:hypothetical protein